MLIRRSNERGQGNFGWLKAKCSFSFSRYFDPKWTGYGPLLVINQDKVDAGQGFPAHSHDNVEIMTYILEGSLQHRDSFGHQAVIKPGEVQLMSAGKGIIHSEMNINPLVGVHLLQIWFHTDTIDVKPTYQQKDFSREINQGLTLVASKGAKEGSLNVNQSVNIYAGKISKGEVLDLKYGWVQVISGEITNGSETLFSGDGAGFESNQNFTVNENCHIIYFEFKT